jgi:putative heme-binding domain-containing protein
LLVAQQPGAVIGYLATTGVSSKDPSEAQAAVTLLATVKHPDAPAMLAALLTEVKDAKAPPFIELEVLRAAEALNGDATIAPLLAAIQAQAAAAGPLGEFRATLHGGNSARGEALFNTHLAAQCTLCHRVAAQGSEVGPPLAKVAATRDRAYFLESLVTPQAVVAPGYGFTSLTLKDGSTVTGTLRDDSPNTVVIAAADGSLVKTPTSAITTRTPPVSTMPPMGSILTKEELRDLIEFLTTLK